MHYYIITLFCGDYENAGMHYYNITLFCGDYKNAGMSKYVTKNFLDSVAFGKRGRVRGIGYKYAYVEFVSHHNLSQTSPFFFHISVVLL